MVDVGAAAIEALSHVRADRYFTSGVGVLFHTVAKQSFAA